MNQSNHPSTGIAVVPRSQLLGKSFFPGSRILLNFVSTSRSNRRYLWIALVGTIIQFITFKLCYPFPDFISDSYIYIESAANHLNVNLWPIGYAKFLAFIHQVSYSDTLLVSIQYILVQASLLYFFYTIKYLYRPSALTMKIIFVALLFNPLFLYLSNCVLSDAVFTSITIIWISLLLWQLQFPNRAGLAVQVILIGMAFVLRYTAIYYPLVAAIALLFCRIGRCEKIAWIVAPTVLLFPFIRFTQSQTKAVTGTAEFSVFGGWQVANNALYMYGHIQVDSAKLPPETRALDRMVKQYYKRAPPNYFNFNDFPGTFFIKHSHAPLKQYMMHHYQKQLDTSSFLAWGKVSPIYTKYGIYLITHYPSAFAQYYLWLNTKKYFTPFLEKFDTYNLESDSVMNFAQYWFHYPSPKVWAVSKRFQGLIFFSYPPIFMVLNLYYVGCLLWLLYTRKYRQLDSVLQKALWLITGLLVVNFWFSILATPVVLRYQVIPMVLLFTFGLLLFESTDFKKTKHA